MNRTADGSSKWNSYASKIATSVVTAALFYAAVVLRSALDYWPRPALYPVLGILAVWLILFATEPIASRRWHWYFPPYLILQSVLAIVLLSMPDARDYIALLFLILSMQMMQRLPIRVAWLCIGAFTLTMAVLFDRRFGIYDGTAFVLIYTAADVLLAFYALATRRAQAAREQNQALARELEQANRRLDDYVLQHEKLATARERQRLARELHDAATQTIFSMTLATQSALILLDRDPSRLGAQLERMNQLASGALGEIRALISELRPERPGQGGLAIALREHLANSHLTETLAVSLDLEGEQPLSPGEEQALFRIAQEALNNVVKHAHAAHVSIRLHLCEPFWIEIQDDGCGFALEQARHSGRVGLSSMRERAAEIGWDVRISTAHGAGTRIRVEKAAATERQA